MIVTADKLGKRYNREWIFRNLTYSFQSGLYAITGPNGSGKSTLLRVLWGQLPHSSGKLQWAGSNGTPIEPDEVYSRLTIATPYTDLVEELTLEEHIRLHFRFKKPARGMQTHEIMEEMELTHARHKPVQQFSSGMKQRLRLGLALLSASDLIFLDEPTTNLDKKAVDWYHRQMGQISQESIVFVGSNLENEYPEKAIKINLPAYK